jgi:uncharacterized protein
VSDVLLAGLALVLVIEGLIPFAMPSAWRAAVRQMAELSDGQLRLIGLTLMIVGLIFLNLVSE